MAILQKGNFKKKYIYEGKQSSDDDSSSLVSFVAFPDDPHPQPKELLDGPFSNQTRQLLYRVPSLKKSIYWNKEYLENFIQVKRNSIPFGNDSDDDENVVDPPSSPPPQVSFSKEETSNPADDIVQTSWLKKYEKILSDDLLEEPQQSKIKSPTTRLPMIFPPLSSTKSIALIESFPIKESQSSHDLMESSLSKKKSVDPLSNKKKIVSSSSQSLLLSKKKFPKMTSSLSKL